MTTTPPPNPSCPSCLQAVGIDNTVKKYRENRPLHPHNTPFERRVEAEMERERALALRPLSSLTPPV